MAGEFKLRYTPATSPVPKAILYNPAGQVRQTTTNTYVTYVAANRANYLISLAETDGDGVYKGDLPATNSPAGLYSVVYLKSPYSAADADVIGGGSVDYDGAGLAYISSRAPASTALDNTVWTNAKAGYLTGDAFARLGAPAGASISADLAAKQATFTASTGVTFPATVASPTNITAGTITTVTTVTNLTNAPAAGDLTAAMKASVSAAVWDLATTGHTTSGTFGAGLVAAGSAGDPWATTLPGSYGAGTAGNIVGTRLDAAVSTRLSTAGYTAPLTAATTRSALGLASANLDAQFSMIPAAMDADDTRAALGLAAANLDAQFAALPTAAQTADKVLGRSLGGGADGGRTVRDALRAGRNKVAFDVPAAGQYTVYAEDDTTPAYTGTYTRADVNSLVGVDPA